MIKFFLKEEPIISQVKTYVCAFKKDLNYVTNNIEKLVLKPVNESGGYGILIGPQSSKSELKKSIIMKIDAKTRLQEFSLKEFKVLPVYKLIASKGPNHKPIFKIKVKIKNSEAEFGIGSSKKIAEQNAANKLLKKIDLI